MCALAASGGTTANASTASATTANNRRRQITSADVRRRVACAARSAATTATSTTASARITPPANVVQELARAAIAQMHERMLQSAQRPEQRASAMMSALWPACSTVLGAISTAAPASDQAATDVRHQRRGDRPAARGRQRERVHVGHHRDGEVCRQLDRARREQQAVDDAQLFEQSAAGVAAVDVRQQPRAFAGRQGAVEEALEALFTPAAGHRAPRGCRVRSRPRRRLRARGIFAPARASRDGSAS